MSNSDFFVVSDDSVDQEQPRPSPEKESIVDNSNQISAEEELLIESLREEIISKAARYTREYEDLKQIHEQQMALYKQENLAQERSVSNAYDLEYRNAVWSATLKHVGKGFFSEDIGSLFQKRINDLQIELERNLLLYQQSCEEEITAAKVEQNYRKHAPVKRKLTAQEAAEVIYDEIDSSKKKADSEVIDKIIERLKKEQQSIQSSPQKRVQEIEPKQRSHKMKPDDFSVSPPPPLPISAPKHRETIHRTKRPKTKSIQQNGFIDDVVHQHVEHRNRLKHTMKKTDRFIRKMKRESDY